MLRIFFILSLIGLMGFSIQKTVTVEGLTGKFDPSEHPDFVQIDAAHTTKSNIYLRKEVYKAFRDMYYDAQKCGIDLKIVSATRNFNYQKGIWERKWTSDRYAHVEGADRVKAIMEFSAMPGTSRHHWGTDIDLNQLNNAYFSSGKGKEVYDWLSDFAPEYGFVQTYTKKDEGRTGYEEEKWHWSYAPLAIHFLEQYNQSVSCEDISGFSGSEHCSDLEIIENYVNGIQIKR